MTEPAVDWPRVLRAMRAAQGSPDERIRRVRALIDRAFADALDIDRLAAEAYLSRAQFIRSFKKAYDTTPHRYVVQRRLDAALHLLETTPLPVTEICLEVGFSSVGSFTTLFRRRFGHAPGRYRRTSVVSLGLARGGPPGCFALLYGGRAVQGWRR